MVPAQDVVRFADPLSAFPSLDWLPACVVAAVVLSSAIALLLVAVGRRDVE